MPKAEHAAPKKKDLKLPECKGCEAPECQDANPDHLYILGQDNRYYCRKCWYRMVGNRWPKPGVYNYLNDEQKFRSEVTKGHDWQRKIYERLAADLQPHGIRVVMAEPTVRKDVKDRGQYKDEIDIMVGPYRVEVHSRNLAFTGPDDYPFETAFVDPKNDWDSANPVPHAMILISQRKGGIAVISAKTQDAWSVDNVYDSVRGYSEDVYLCPRNLLVSYERLRDFYIMQLGRKNVEAEVCEVSSDD